ncbi:pilus assembly protein [Nitratireductor soli]|uniref:pilus assembly protein n=1 Tax=Nitratireductor soli TaxID=1670619 RepID=UPI00065E2C99|nr:pilus assembly protein [Nitratireductor soli]
MLRTFLQDRRGNFAMMTALLMAPVMGVLALAVDYTQMTRQRQMTLNALDAAGIATARRISDGATQAEAEAYAEDFFRANLGAVKPENATLHVLLPNDNTGGGTLKLTADLKYAPIFFPVFQSLRGEAPDGVQKIDFRAESEIRLKNTLEVALVLDNSGSMDFTGTGSTEKRMTVLKKAAKELVKTIANEGAQMKQISKPVQFGLVPFAGAVNVGPQNDGASWMDTDGRSPTHHENFDWDSMKNADANKRVEKSGGVYYKRGTGWKDQENAKVTRFTLYDDIKRITGYTTEWGCASYYSNGTCRYEGWIQKEVHGPFASWGGCVEMRPYPYNLNDVSPASSKPETYFVPMFAPDETNLTDGGRPANNNWWPDISTSNAANRQAYMPKYFVAQSKSAMGLNEGPNAGCTTKPITPLTDVSNAAGLDKINKAIDAMQPSGSTNVTEGLAWGWRVVSSGEPFTEGRSENENGNDKVVIVLTDGANTYYTPSSVTAYSYSGGNYNYGGNDLAGTHSLYSNYGYAVAKFRTIANRIFDGTANISKSDYSNSNYSAAMTQHMAAACENAKAGRIIMMTVALDLKLNDAAEKKQIDALKACASESRTRKDADGKPEKLFWNATGGNLDQKFKEIGDELSNLRIVG